MKKRGTRLNSADQRAYLEALDIPVWVSKDKAGQVQASSTRGLVLGPGSSETLLVCSGLEEPASRIAADIVRSLGNEPVWAWPGETDDDPSLAAVVDQNLFTAILVFGNELETSLFSGNVPATIGSARVLTAASLEKLAESPGQRKSLWKLISRNKLTVSQSA